ncbi:DUF5667 domain-containing protein [Acidobacteria bacterium AH-259-O06]|nr:DUF5667 domain-containing protein [Acidobacteria bacterium AH-259-O06]
MFRFYLTILLTAAFLSFPLAMAQDSEEFDEPLSKKEAKQTVKLADEALEDAERAQRRGDTPGMERALENYSRHMNKLERGLHEGKVRQDEREDVAEIVAQATYKHTEVLEGLYDKVPEQAHKGINRAYEASQRGHDTAFENLTKKRREELTRRHEMQRARSSRAASSRSDDSLRGSRPSTRPGTVRGPSRGPSQRRGGRGRH